MIDDGETDWKLIGIDINDERAANLNGKIMSFFFYPMKGLKYNLAHQQKCTGRILTVKLLINNNARHQRCRKRAFGLY